MFSYVNFEPSPQQRGILIHIPQTSGVVMSRHLHPRASRMFLAHATASFVRYQLGDSLWRKMFTFAFVRNPWERLVYWYELYRRKHKSQKMLSFEEFLSRDTMIMGSFAHNGWTDVDLWSQSVFLTSNGSSSGKVIVDFVGRVENVESDFGYICDKLEIRRPQEPLDMNNTRHLHYSTYYHSKELVALVARRCSWEINKYGYKFEKEAL